MSGTALAIANDRRASARAVGRGRRTGVARIGGWRYSSNLGGVDRDSAHEREASHDNCGCRSPRFTDHTCGSRPAGPGAPPGNFVYFGRDHERMLDSAFFDHPRAAGAQLTYTWRELEPERDRYDFAAIRERLAFLRSHGKRLFLQISDVTFTERAPVPDYLLSDSTFHGGAARKYEGADGVFDGWVARRWDPAVRARFALLLEALAQRFDGLIEGINLAETAIGFESPAFHPPGFTFDAYAAGVRANLENTRRAFRRSCVIIYANFMPGESLPTVDRGYLRSIYALADRIGAGVGGPDLLPFRKGQQANSLPLIARRGPGVVAGVAIQDGNLSDLDPATGRPVTVDALYRYAVDSLRLDYVFWGAQEPYLTRDVLPYLRELPYPRSSERS